MTTGRKLSRLDRQAAAVHDGRTTQGDMRVAYLGPKGTYSQEAAAQHFSRGFDSVFCTSLAGVVESVVAGHADQAVLPVENSTNGPVNPALDALLFTPGADAVQVCGEVRVAVRHQLYTRARSLATIDTVYSHPQVWGQSRRWLEAHLPRARRIDCESTAAAVALALARPSPSSASRENEPQDLPAAEPETVAALGGPLTSDEQPLYADCADNPTNTTRFLVLRRAPAPAPPAAARRIVAVAHSTTAGRLLRGLAAQAITPDVLLPRPARGDWEYSFYLEFANCGGAIGAAAAAGATVVGSYD